MEIEDIRKCFSKGSVSVTENGIYVFYTYKDRWVTQSIYEEHMQVFENLLKTSEKFGISISKGKYIRFSFLKPMKNQETIFYNPLEDEVSLEELDGIISSLTESGSKRSEEFFDFFMGTDLDDESEVLEKLNEWITKINGSPGKIIDMSIPIRFNQAYQYAMKLAGILRCDIDIQKPGNDNYGYVQFQFPEDFKKAWLSGKSLGEMANLVELSTAATVECQVIEGFLDLTFSICEYE